MSKHWEKEDRHCWQKSEVMQNFEKTLLANYATLEAHSKIITAEKMTVPQVKEMKTTLDGAAASAKELNRQLSGTSAADDGEVSDNTEDCAACHSADDKKHKKKNELKWSDGEKKPAFNQNHKVYVADGPISGTLYSIMVYTPASTQKKEYQTFMGDGFGQEIKWPAKFHSLDDAIAHCQFLEDSHNDFFEDNIEDQTSADHEYSEDEVKLAKTSLLAELRKMASDAIAIRDMALAYQVERTIQELLEPEDND